VVRERVTFESRSQTAFMVTGPAAVAVLNKGSHQIIFSSDSLTIFHIHVFSFVVLMAVAVIFPYGS
jgi:hypothetical protein